MNIINLVNKQIRNASKIVNIDKNVLKVIEKPKHLISCKVTKRKYRNSIGSSYST